MNETYPIGDKRAIEILEASSVSPKNFSTKVKAILSCKKTLNENLELLKNLFAEVIDLAGSNYKALYNFN